MTYGDSIIGLNKILEWVPDFRWNQFDQIMDFRFWGGLNELCENTNFIEFTFRLNCGDNDLYYVRMQFEDIEGLNIKYISKINQLMGFEIVDKSKDGWIMKYFVNDYENSAIEFYCNSIEVIDICKCN